MQINKRLVLTVIVILVIFALAACQQQITAQMIPGKEFREWFYWRLLFTLIGVSVLGVVLSFIFRTFNAKGSEMKTNKKARILFGIVLGFIIFIIPFGLWTEAYLTQPFARPISWANYFSLIVTNTNTLSIVILSVIVFYLVVMLFTRFIFELVGITCDCRYAFLPVLKRSNK